MAILTANNIVVNFERRGNGFFAKKEKFQALKGVSVAIEPGQTLGLVGESGSGKSTLARAIMRLQAIDAGTVFYGNDDVSAYSARMPLALRRRVQMVFQNPDASLNPRQTVAAILSEPLEIHFPQMDKTARRERVAELLEMVELPVSMAQRFPHEFSGGQRQRIAIARALATQAQVVICDEPVSALDVSVQAQIIKLLQSLQKHLGLAYLFVGHDLAVVKELADCVAVMCRGEIVETGTPDDVFYRPQHPYTQHLLAAVPRI
ncbi:MAG: ATP-binding cassette domain-containing protein [Opitutales bacterium]|nr:ATP-binding cassette domain-containing protein [Opitutales bacterium]